MNEVLETRKKAWDVIFNDPNLSLNSLRHRAVAGTVCQNGLRSVCWKVFLGYFPALEVSSWSSLQLEQRQRYTDLKRTYIEEPAEKMNKKGEQNLSDNNPLALSDSNPWQQYFADSEIRKVIRQDVERTFPDVDFFRQNEVQQRLTDILFIYCKLNRDVSYRQGMHELLAPFYWVLALEGLDTAQLDQLPSDPATKLMIQVLDSNFVEHDAYILFDKLMTFGQSWYVFNEDVPSRKAPNARVKSDVLTADNIPKPTDSARLNPVVMTCHRIHHQYLRTVDPLLYRHLENFGIEPQLYGLRWIRLLFGREFDIYELLKLWDAIFAQDQTLEIVEYVCLVILLRMRDQLLQKDYAECLTLLMRPPQITKPATLVEQAKYLKENLSEDTALHILQQLDVRSGKDPRTSMSDGVPEPAPPISYARQQQQHQQQQRILNHKGSQGFDSLSRIMMKNPQVRDLNRAIAGVMKNVNTFGENVLGRPQEGISGRRSTVSSEFPSGIDRIVGTNRTYHQRQSSPPVPPPKHPDQEPTAVKLQSVNRQMGEMMAKCISLLENEIFSSQPTNKEEEEATEAPIESTTADVDISDEVVEYDSDASTSLSDKKPTPARSSIQRTSFEAPAHNEVTMIMALAGLKHVRDVLLGKQMHFDASVLDDNNRSQDVGVSETNDEWKWDLVDHKEVIDSSSSPPVRVKPRAIFVPPQTSSSIISADDTTPTNTAVTMPTNSSYEKNKPLPPIATPAVYPELPQVAVPYIPAHPAPLKQQIKYRIEDLLSDPDLQLLSPKSSNNPKLKWMIDNDSENKSKSDILATSPSTDLFKADQVPSHSPRKRTSFIVNKKPSSISGTTTTSAAAIDPLDAKNIENRKSYEYDIL